MKCSVLSLLFSLLILLVVPSTRADEVTFNGKFNCEIPSRSEDYCMMLQYMEDDIRSDDIISIGKIKCGGPKESHVNATFDGGDGIFNYYYEFFVTITHNCTQDGRIRSIRHVFPDVLIDTINKTLNFEVDLTEHGISEKKYDIFPNMDPILSSKYN